MVTIKLIGLVAGEPTDFDGQYLVEYDPVPLDEGDGDFIHLIVTEDPAKAKQFATLEEAVALYRASSGTRPDGEPDRPLTAYSVMFESPTRMETP